MIKKRRVFSGTRPTGHLHLGNYFGAIKGYLKLQDEKNLDCIYAIVDLHGVTSPYNPKTYPKEVTDLVLDYLACGLDPKKSHLIIQSHLPQHLELAYYLSTIYPVSRLEQLPTYKEKKLEQPKYINLGLLYYPILMAADILIYKAELVPVGKDQLPHLELTREVARMFNNYFGKTFPEPQAFLTSGSYVPSLTGEGKMSKTNENSYISLIDDLDTIKKKLAKVPTDLGHGNKVPQQGGINALLTLVELFMGKLKREQYEKQYLTTGIKYQPLKNELAQYIYNYLKPIQAKRAYYQKHPQLIKEIIENGERYALGIVQKTLLEVKRKMGFR
ncbi:MAG: tryptophan--tRNA ligase [Parcubacteria group bacterium]|nr:tryptophan--tRNA ligase [Parcubacteria group bacterium]